MTLLTRTVSLLHVSFFVLVSAFLIMDGIAQEASNVEVVEFDCRSAKTVSHELSVWLSTARFKGTDCICGDTAEEAKNKLLVEAFIQSDDVLPEFNVPDTRGDAPRTHTKDLQVEEGKTAKATIYCYDWSVLQSLIKRRAQ